MNHYPHHIGDFDKATRHLTRLERSVYRDLLDMYYDKERPIPLDVPKVCRLILATSNEESTSVQQVLNEFFTETPAGWYHAKCEEVIAHYHTNTSQAAAAGRASAAARAAKKALLLNSGSTGDATGVGTDDATGGQQTGNVDPTNQNHNHNHNQIKKGAKPPLDKSGFDEFWNAWPKNERKQDKAKCKAKWEANGYGAVLTAILADINVKLGTDKWKEGFIEAPEVYLNNKRWEDGVTANAPGGAALPVPWQDSAAGVDAKAAELGLAPIGPTENRPNFKIRVMAAVLNPPKPMSLDALNALLAKREVA